MSSEESSHENSASPSAQPFLYTPAAGENGQEPGNSANGGLWGPPGADGTAAAQREQQAYQKGLSEGEARTRAECEKALAELRSQISGALREFTAQRSEYFENVEPEVVQLALSISRKILHREAQIDPLLLTGMVHVALEKLNAGTQTRLRANPHEIRAWRDYFAQAEGTQPTPELVGDPAMAVGQCVLESEFGSTQISLDAQLKEIEQGFLDLLEQRPRVQG